MTNEKPTQGELERKKKAGRKLDANIEKFLKETSKGR